MCAQIMCNMHVYVLHASTQYEKNFVFVIRVHGAKVDTLIVHPSLNISYTF